MKNKALKREKMIESLKSFNGSERQKQTDEILENFFNSKEYKEANSVATVMSMPFEFDNQQILQDSNKKILIPKVMPQRKMLFAAYEPEKLVKSSFGLLEPQIDEFQTEAETPDLIIVPGLVWNEEGFRIGFGGGYYDRYLADYRGVTVGFAYDFQVQEFEAETHDVAIQQLFTVK